MTIWYQSIVWWAHADHHGGAAAHTRLHQQGNATATSDDTLETHVIDIAIVLVLARGTTSRPRMVPWEHVSSALLQALLPSPLTSSSSRTSCKSSEGAKTSWSSKGHSSSSSAWGFMGLQPWLPPCSLRTSWSSKGEEMSYGADHLHRSRQPLLPSVMGYL